MTTAEDKPKQTRNSEATRQRILAAATQEFAKKGFDGARIDDIARAAQANKQMIYHYFGNKDDLFTTVLEDAYSTLRQHEAEVDLNLLPANEAILALLESTWQHYLENPELIRLLAAENQMEARHLKANNSFQEINDAHVNRMKHLLERGQREGMSVPALTRCRSISASLPWGFSTSAIALPSPPFMTAICSPEKP